MSIANFTCLVETMALVFLERFTINFQNSLFFSGVCVNSIFGGTFNFEKMQVDGSDDIYIHVTILLLSNYVYICIFHEKKRKIIKMLVIKNVPLGKIF